MAKTVGLQEIDVSKLVPSKFNVRRHGGSEDVTELANSIEELGIVEPLVVRKTNGKFEVIAGSLRVRAAKEVGLKTVPAIVKEMSDEEARMESLVENIQRHTLSPDDEAEAFAELFKVLKSSQTIAEKVGCSRKRVDDALAVKGLIETLKSGAAPKKSAQLIRDAPRKRVLSDVARVAKTVYHDQPKKVERLLEEVVELPESDARKILDRVRIYPERSVEKIKEEVLYAPQSITISVQFGSKIVRGIDEACKAHRSSREEIVELAVETWLKDEKYL